MKNKKGLRVIVAMLVLVMAISLFTSCTVKPTETETPAPEVTPEETAVPEATSEPRNGGWLDEVTFVVVPNDAAVTQISADEIDIWAGTLAGADNLEAIEGAELQHSTSRGLYYEIMMNPTSTTEVAGTLNPFDDKEVREAMNWLIDREYICQEIFGGTATPKYVPQAQGLPEYGRYIKYIREVEAKYAYDKEKAVAIIDENMTAHGAVKDEAGKWTYEGNPVTIIALIRTEDGIRKPIGDYVCNELESIGFTTDRQYKTSSECSAIWSGTDPHEGQWNLYTGAWGITGMSRDDGDDFQFHYSYASLYGFTTLYQSYAEDIDDEWYQLTQDLALANFTSMEERETLFAEALRRCNEFSFRVWIVDGQSFTPWDTDVTTSYDLAAGVDISELTPFTIRFKDQVGGSLVWANSDLFVNPANPVGGSNWTMDHQYENFVQDNGVLSDPFTGLQLPERIERAEVVMQTGLPVGKTYDWVDLSFEDEIAVPADAMIDWDPVAQTWISADQAYLESKVANATTALAAAQSDPEATEDSIAAAQAVVDAAQADLSKGYLTAKRKSVVYYPENLYDVTWHDGTKMSVADFMLAMIVTFDAGTEGSPYYDSYLAPTLDSFKSGFKGWKIVSEDPLVIEYYSDVYSMDAETNVQTLWPNYGYGHSNWADMAISLQAVATGSVTFTEGTATDNEGVEWLNWLAGPSLEILKASAEECKANSFIPYAPTMGAYVTAEQAVAAYDNILNFYSQNGHFYIGCGPYYISAVDSTAKTLTVKNNPNFIDDASKWSNFSEPKLATADIDGPGSVVIGSEASFDVYVTFGADAENYPANEIQNVVFLVYDSTGAVVADGEGVAVEDGLYSVTLDAETTGALSAGSCKLEVIVSLIPVAVPAIASVEFIAE